MRASAKRASRIFIAPDIRPLQIRKTFPAISTLIQADDWFSPRNIICAAVTAAATIADIVRIGNFSAAGVSSAKNVHALTTLV